MRKIIISLFFLYTSIYSQVVFTAMNNSVYDFLERLALKKIIYLADEVKPFSRNYISGKLSELENNFSLLNNVEKDELEFYKREYAYELAHQSERWFLYAYTDSLFRIRVTPLLGFGISGTGGSSGYTRWPGFKVYAAFSKNFSAFFEYKDVGEFGGNVDRKKLVTPATGHYFKFAPDGIEYSDVKGAVSYDFKGGSLSLIKDYTIWGHSHSGSLILSDKAPSFPHLRLNLNPVPWLRFTYIHGWLNSMIPDSSSFQYNNMNSSQPFLRMNYVNKYFAGNILTAQLSDWLDVSVGNSYVYSGDLRPEMFIPFMYYKVMDQNTGRGNTGDGNGQIFFDISVNYPRTFRFYSTLLIDVLDDREILKGNWFKSWFGYSAGFRKADLLVNNLSLTVEYFKTNPYVYEHKDETTNYKHVNFSLGHWMGQNADYLKLQFDYVIMRGFAFTLYWERLRKGGLNDISKAYDEPIYLPFLSGDVKKDYRLGIKTSYEPMHELLIRAEYDYSDIRDQDITRTPAFLLGTKSNYVLLVSYGM